MAASDPTDITLVAPALLQLNRGSDSDNVASNSKTSPFESCPSPPCGASITPFPDCPDCLECRTSSKAKLKCNSCWTACASPCNDDDCHIPQPCYEEHCAVESCVDSACATDSCTDVTCPETVHFNATCVDTNCLYNSGDNAASYDSQDCGPGHCFGFLPVGSMNPFGTSNDLLYQCPQAAHPMGAWEHLALSDTGYQQHDHVDHNRHKRRRLQTDGYNTLFDAQQQEPWSDDQLDAMFSPEAFNMNFDTSLSGGVLDFGCADTCHQHLKTNDAWPGDMTSSLPCCPAPERTSQNLKRRASRPARLLPAPSPASAMSPASLPTSALMSPITSSSNSDLVCRWASGNSICGHRFSSAKDLDDHLQHAHTSKLGPSAFICLWEGCDTPFKHRGKLNRHISGAHSKYHAYVCSHTDPFSGEPCDRTFCTKEQLKNHETTHTGERKYKCRFCDHTSATKTQHNTHERIHTKEKPYQCPWCGHRSGDSSNLSKHVRNKHPGMAGRAKKSASVEAPGVLSA